jgi:hypothetical protein
MTPLSHGSAYSTSDVGQALPFLTGFTFAHGLITNVPGLSLWLPKLIGP